MSDEAIKGLIFLATALLAVFVAPLIYIWGWQWGIVPFGVEALTYKQAWGINILLWSLRATVKGTVPK